MTFEKLGLNAEILKAVADLGFEQPSEIQEKSIPQLLESETDLMGLAQTGTGKTAAFGLPLLQKIDFTSKDTQGLVICPTRELCNQITKDFKSFSKYLPKPNVVAVYGGASIDNQIKSIKRGAHVIVATPGRLVDLIKRKAIKLETVQIAVLDEADEMLNMGFKEDIDFILSKTPQEKSTWLFSATMPKEVRRITKEYMEDPFEVTVGTKNTTAKNIEHIYYMVKERDRYLAVKRLLDFYPDIFGLIFCRTKRETGMISEKLEKEGYNVTALHGDLSQAQRDAAMKKFRERTVQVLVATDVAARGIDVDSVTHVIHYNLPDDVENYTHRSGRTARAGKSGMSLSLINTKESYKIRQIEKIIGSKIEYKKIPGSDDIREQQMMALVDRVVNTEVNENELDKYWDMIYEKFQNFSAEEVVMKFISAEFNRFIEYYKKSGDLNASKNDRDSGGSNARGDKKNRNLDGESQRFFINLGEKQNLNKGALVRLVCTTSGINSKDIGRIEVHGGYSFFEVSKSASKGVVSGMTGKDYEGKDFVVEETEPRKGGGGSGRKKRSGGRSGGRRR